MSFPILNLNGIRISTFETKHLTQRYISWLNDPEVVQYSEQRHHKHTLITCQRYFEMIQKTCNYFLAIEIEHQAPCHIGNIGVSIDPYNRIADLSILIGEKQIWGTGVASIAWGAVIKEMFDNQGIRKITSGTMAVNKPMLRMMKRSGMHIEAIRRDHFLWNESEVDLIQAAIFESVAGS